MMFISKLLATLCFAAFCASSLATAKITVSFETQEMLSRPGLNALEGISLNVARPGEFEFVSPECSINTGCVRKVTEVILSAHSFPIHASNPSRRMLRVSLLTLNGYNKDGTPKYTVYDGYQKEYSQGDFYSPLEEILRDHIFLSLRKKYGFYKRVTYEDSVESGGGSDAKELVWKRIKRNCDGFIVEQQEAETTDFAWGGFAGLTLYNPGYATVTGYCLKKLD